MFPPWPLFAAVGNIRIMTANTHGVQVTLEELINLRYQAQLLDLSSRKKVISERMGGHISGFRGRGMDFEEVRAYMPGDDIRSMDWRVTARTGSPHTKVYHEERERPVFIVVDLSPTMFFGTRVAFKSVVASRAAALMSWAAMANGDRVGGILFSPEHSIEIPPKSRQFGVLPLLKGMVQLATPTVAEGHSIGLTETLLRLRRVVKPGGLVFLFSDFYALDTEAESHLGHLARKSEIHAFFVSDPIERTPPPSNQYTFAQGKRRITIDTRLANVCQRYQQQFIERQQQLQRLCFQYKIPLFELQTHDDVGKKLAGYFAQRRSR